MSFTIIFLKYFMFVLIFFISLQADLPGQLTTLQGKLGGLKNKLGNLKTALGTLKDELSKKDETTTAAQTIINTISSDPTQGISEVELPPELKKIAIDTPEKKEILQQALTHTFEILSGQDLDALMASVLFDKPTNDEKKKIVQTAAAQAWVNRLDMLLQSHPDQALDKFVEGATVYAENKCTIPIQTLQQPINFLSATLNESDNPQAMLKKLETIAQEKEKTHQKKKYDEFTQLTGNEKNKLNAIDQLTKQNLITIATIFFKAKIHSTFEGKPKNLNAFKDYLVFNGIQNAQAQKIITLLNSLDKSALSNLVNANDKYDNLAYIQVLLEFIDKKDLLDEFEKKLKPGVLANVVAAFFAGPDKTAEVNKQKTLLLKIQNADLAKLENQALAQIKVFITTEKKLQTTISAINPKNFISTFEQIQSLETNQQKVSLKNAIKNKIVIHKTANALGTQKEDLVKLDSLTLDPFDFLENHAFSKQNHSNFINAYTLLFRNVFHAQAVHNIKLSDYLEDVFDCFDQVTKLLLFKNKNKLFATVEHASALTSAIDNAFKDIISKYYLNKPILQNNLIPLILNAGLQFLKTRFNDFKDMLFENLLDISLSLCSNVALIQAEIQHLSDEEKTNLLKNIVQLLSEVEAPVMRGSQVGLIEQAQKNIPILKNKLQAAQEEDNKQQIQAFKNQIEKINAELEKEKNKTQILIELSSKKNFNSSQWKPTNQAFLQATELSLRLNLINKPKILENWEQAIKENRGGEWHQFLLNNNQVRGALRETFLKLKYEQLINDQASTISTALKKNQDLKQDYINQLTNQFPQYSQYWLKLIDVLFTQIKDLNMAILNNFNNQLPKLQDYLAYKTYLTERINQEKQSAAVFGYLNDVMKLIKKEATTLTVQKLEQDIPYRSDAWYALIREIRNKISPSTQSTLITFISGIKTKPIPKLLEYLGSDLFVDAVVNKATASKHTSSLISIHDPRISAPFPKPKPSPSPSSSDSDDDWETEP